MFWVPMDRHSVFNPIPYNISGVYFLWLDKRIVYVGMSKDIRNRLTTAHHAIRKGRYLPFTVSYILEHGRDQKFLEHMYIASCRPCLNEGGTISAKTHNAFIEAVRLGEIQCPVAIKAIKRWIKEKHSWHYSDMEIHPNYMTDLTEEELNSCLAA